MTGAVRRGGKGRLPDGGLLTWSVAEGARGRRWRAAVVRDDVSVTSLLLETGLDGRPARLEVNAAAGLLTLHPSTDEGELHGNVVTPTGIRHLAFGWSPGHELAVVDLPLVAVAAVGRLARTIAIGEGSDLATVLVGPSLRVSEGQWHVERITDHRWRSVGHGPVETLEVDAEGLPAGLEDAETWPLER